MRRKKDDKIYCYETTRYDLSFDFVIENSYILVIYRFTISNIQRVYLHSVQCEKRIVSRSIKSGDSRSERSLLPLCRLSVYAQRFFSFNDTRSIKNWTILPLFLFFFFFFLFLTSFTLSFVHFLDDLWFLVSFRLFATTDRSFPFSIICRDGPSAIDFSRGTWLPATEPEGKRGVRSGKRSTTIWHEARRWLPAPLSPFLLFFFPFYPRCLLAPRKQRKCFHATNKNFEKTSTGKTKFIP